MSASVLCSECFRDQGLRLDAERHGNDDSSICSNCRSAVGRKLDARMVEVLAYRFFVRGTIRRFEYGGAPLVQFNKQQATSITPPRWLESDISLFEKVLGVGFFHYGPRFWMFGEIEPLKSLRHTESRPAVIRRILDEYPGLTLPPSKPFYRIRKHPEPPDSIEQYDSPPDQHLGVHRLDSSGFPVLYASDDLDLCVHECRVTAEDELYVATLSPREDLQLLNLAALIEEDVSEFESLDLAVHMLFLAGNHSYEVSRDIARAAKAAGFDGLSYPSYFSLLRTGATPFLTTLGMSHRMIPQYRSIEQALVIPNLALFGRPIADGRVAVECINRLVITRVDYDFLFGPATF